ncbi:MAG: nitrilase-related carbon-nitrogen hydrolase [Bacteroidota bacterium]
MDILKISIVQSHLHWQDINANLHHLQSVVLNDRIDTDLIILPEMFSTGFTMDTTLAEAMEQSIAIDWMRNIAQTKKAAVTGSLIIKEKDQFFNRLVWVYPNGSIETYDKRHLFSYANEDLNILLLELKKT